jgi:hypothetical protein
MRESSLSRIRIVWLFATVVVLAAALAACGGGSSNSSNEDPQKVVESASLEGVESGELDLSLHVDSKGKEGGNADVSLSGAFEAGEKGELPQLQLNVKANGSAKGEPLDFNGGLTVLTDRAYVEYKGTSYEVDPTTFGFLKSTIEQAQQQEGGEASDPTACQKAAEGIKFSQFTDNLVNEGSADVEGTSTTKVSGDLNPGGAIDALIKLTEAPACAAQLEAAGPLPLDELEEAKGELSKAIKKSHVELYVGGDDIVRKFAIELTVQPPEAKNETVEIELELTLSGVNEEQSFSKPESAKPLEALFKKLNINPLELLEATEGGGIGNLLEGLGGPSSGSGSSSGGNSEISEVAGQKEYVQCLQKAQTPTDLQKCASLIE